MWHTRTQARRAIRGGVAGGVAGGFVLALLLIFAAAGSGHDPWTALKRAGAPFLHHRATTPGFDPVAVLVGIASHFAVSVVWGVAFGLLAYGLTRAGTIVLGAVWGLVVWIGMYFLVLPAIGLGAITHARPPAFAMVLHIAFGLAVSFGFLPFQRTHWRTRARFALR